MKHAGKTILLMLLAALLSGGAVSWLMSRQKVGWDRECAGYERQIAALSIQPEGNPIDAYFDRLLRDPKYFSTYDMQCQAQAALAAWRLELERALDGLGDGQYPQDGETKEEFLASIARQDQLLEQLLFLDMEPDTAPAQRGDRMWYGSMYSYVSVWRRAGLYAGALEKLNTAVGPYREGAYEYAFGEEALAQLRSALWPDSPEEGLYYLPPLEEVMQ